MESARRSVRAIGAVEAPEKGPGKGRRRSPSPAEDPSEVTLRLCHDLVTPAVTIRHLAESLRATREPSDLERIANLIVAESTTITEICAFVLERSREPTVVRLDRIVSDCTSSARGWFGGTIIKRLKPVTIHSERVPMLRLVANLVTNACRAAEPDGEVRASLGTDGDDAILEISNTGATLEPSLLLDAGPSTTPPTLGLRIVKGILAQHGGTIDVEPRVPGGTMIRVRIPLDGGSTPSRPAPT
jgi:signal transduction histidine kinase